MSKRTRAGCISNSTNTNWVFVAETWIHIVTIHIECFVQTNYMAAYRLVMKLYHTVICIPHEFVSTQYGRIKFHLETICCHVIHLHEKLDMYCNDMYLCFRIKLSIRVCPAWHASRTSLFQHDTIWYNFILILIWDDLLSCHLSAQNTGYVF